MQEIVPENTLSVANLILNSSVMAKGVLLLLLLFSVVSWAIILQKYVFFKNAKNEDRRFFSYFSKADNFLNIHDYARELKYSTVARLFLIGYRELYVFQEMTQSKKSKSYFSENEKFVSARDIKGISLAVNKGINAEISRLSRRRLDFFGYYGQHDTIHRAVRYGMGYNDFIQRNWISRIS